MTTIAENPFGEPTTRDFLDEIEHTTDFWNRKPQLQDIAWRAALEGVSPWGMLLAVELHRLSQIPPTVVLVKRNGSRGRSLVAGTSLNMFGGLVAVTGGGKSVIFRESQEIITPVMRPIPDGTGQGLVKAIAETEKRTRDKDGKLLPIPYYITRFNRHSLVVHAPEIKSLNAEFEREGSKTDSVMRSLWSGETTGMTTGDRERRVALPPNTYRIAGLWGVQPVNATSVLSGVDDGTPQRWVWAPAEEYRRGPRTPSRIPSQGCTYPVPVWQVGGNPYGVSGGELPMELSDADPLPAPIWVDWSPQMKTDILAARAARDELLNRDPYVVISDDQAAAEHKMLMESHLVLTRIKLAAALGFLWGHTSPDDQDWELSGVQLEVSRGELAGVWQRCEESHSERMLRLGRDRGMSTHYARQTVAELETAELHEHADRLFKKLAKAKIPANRNWLTQNLSSAQRKNVNKIINILETQGRIWINHDNAMYHAVLNGAPVGWTPPEGAIIG